MGFAGLYSWWPDRSKPDDDPDRWVLTATIVTSDAVQTLADIHDRNPVILPQQKWEQWLDPSLVGDQALVDEAVRAGVAEASTLTFDAVAPFGVRDDGSQLIHPRA
jgi:putative SOS response-associated peptidase YedK